ncbi:MAG: family 2 glycosyl transferase [Pseudanabaena frigida]|uniref:Family 2 glycosyl transferase n=1 Tax=Pseudanabaena frigida TaxID=945775 RepID=A0A2W4W2F4_9CYAN|nr:MAG: family 2 glycosyl transferase [Pseudanabaena frigida]
MNPLISVIICTHNPNQMYFQRTLNGLQEQTLINNIWELIIVDNATPDPQYIPSFDISWLNYSKIIIEKNLGLTRARLAGIQASQGNYIVFVDDDNVLDPNYLENIVSIFSKYPNLGAIGGKSLPEFEISPEAWIKDFWVCLALRDLGEDVQTYFYSHSPNQEKYYPSFAPIGAGMTLQREAAIYYANSVAKDPKRLELDRTGKSLRSGGDCDINLTLLDSGWGVGYFPQLQLSHLISANRLTKEYLARLNYAASLSWIQVLDSHNIRPWEKIPRWSVLPRKLKSFFNCQAWKSPSAFVSWRGTCGTFEGLADLDG